MNSPFSSIGTKIRRRRHELGWSLDTLASKAGVSKAMLGQIEREESSPTVGILWKIATGLEISFSTLLDSSQHKAKKKLFTANTQNLVSDTDGIEAYTLIPFTPSMGFELMVVSLAANSTHISSPHAVGVVEHVIPLTAAVEIGVNKRWSKVEVGQALRFPADLPHSYRNRNNVKVTFHNLIRYT